MTATDDEHRDAAGVWDDFDRFFMSDFEAMNKRLSRMFADFMGTPGVKMYGYTMCRGPDGVPHVQEFGNTREGGALLTDRASDPLTDVTLDGEVVRAVAEIPGVAKEDIVLDGTPTSLTITVDTEKRKFSKTLAMPCEVDVSSAKATYNNGILEVALDTVRPAENRTRIDIV